LLEKQQSTWVTRKKKQSNANVHQKATINDLKHQRLTSLNWQLCH